MPVKDYNNYMKQYMLKRYHKRRAEAIEQLGGRCVECLSDRNLEIDHIDKDTKSFGISKLWSCSYEKFQDELAKCQLLCKSCHQDKSTREHRIWIQQSEPRTCACGKSFGNHSKYSGHRRWCQA